MRTHWSGTDLGDLRSFNAGRTMQQMRRSFRGTVLSGRGKARGHMNAEYDAFRASTGENLIPGSLNLVLSKPVYLNSKTAVLVSGGARLLWRAELLDLPVWIYRFPHAPLHVIEVLSSVRLRNALGLQDGDTAILYLSGDDIEALSPRQRLAWNLLWKGRESWYYRKDWYCFRTRSLSIDIGATQKPTQRGVIRSLLGFVRRGFR